MIHEIQITDPKDSPTPWWGDLPAFKDKTAITFKPGLNILYGPNGSGKSTVLTLLAKMLMCEQGGTQLVSQTGLREVWDRKTSTLKQGLLPIHDGAPVSFFNPDKQVGLIGGQFDYDFMMEGVMNCMSRESSGQGQLRRLGDHLGAILKGEFPEEVSWKLPRDRYKALEDFLKGNYGGSEKGPPTVILDEPGRSLDARTEYYLFKRLQEAKDVQIIMASHSAFALHLPDAHIIEMEERYLEKARLYIETQVIQTLIERDPKHFQTYLEMFKWSEHSAKLQKS